MRRLRDERGVRFVFVGSGKRRAEVEAFVKQHGLTNVSWHDYQPREKLGRSLSAGDVHLITVRAGAEGTIVPSKLFGVMAVARPSIFIGSESSEVARVLAECDGGVLVREGDGAGLAGAILSLRDDPSRRAAMGARARAHLAGRYDRETACARWVTLLESLA
jgi:glycosyltransferase involved in cell wall biosynthesis